MSNTLEKVFQEKSRIEKVSRIREIVFGSQDGLLVPLGVVSSVAGAFSNNHIVIIAGISEALAGAFSMATGAYLASQAESQVFTSEINKELQEVTEKPEEEKKELASLLQNEGMSIIDSNSVVKLLFKAPKAFTNTLIQKELGIEPEPPGTPITDAIYVGISYLISAVVPIIPYVFIPARTAIYYSIGLTLLALFAIGMLKAKV